jgi:rhamnogalacturonan endolyase
MASGVTSTSAPSAKPSEDLDTSFFSELGVQGYVPNSGRGTVSGRATGVPSEFETVVHWHNTQAQYWTKASDGNYKSPSMKPGSYTTKLYKGEFLVATTSVSVEAGKNTNMDIASKEANNSVIWRIGDFDGQPFDLKNGDKIERMHPSDVRMGSWGGSYTVEKSSAKEFPMALWSKQGGQATVTFSLTQDQVKAHVLRIGTTLSFKGGRPSVKIGSWTGSDPGAPVSPECCPPMTMRIELTPSQKLIDSRGLTRGAYRGYGEVYTWNVPASALKAGTNTLTVGVSGGGDASWLSANYIVDALELQD